MFSFPGQQPDEKTLMVVHRHWLPFTMDIVRVLLLAAIPTGLLWGGLALTGVQLSHDSVGFAAIVMVGSLYYAFLAILLYGFWLEYYLDLFVVTDKRVVDIEQRGLLSRTISEQPLYRIQDVTSEIDGFMAHIFHFGNVYIQTAGKQERFFFAQIPHPETAVRTILALTDSIIRAEPKLALKQERTGKP